jgi:hypothetical protein
MRTDLSARTWLQPGIFKEPTLILAQARIVLFPAERKSDDCSIDRGMRGH